MELVRIAELTPELPAPESKQLKAVVTLIWPYSSSTRQFAFLLAEPQLRLRRNKGQVRVCFSGSSAKAIATTGVRIGDEVVLALQGAQFLRGGSASTPGKSIDWELSYHHAVTLQVFRSGSDVANLDLVHVTPTPTPHLSPVRQPSAAIQTSAQQWSSPAFLKRLRLSDGPFIDAPLDPFADELEIGRGKKRRRKSYKDWKAWTYSARTPSPTEEDITMEDEFDIFGASPSRPMQLPKTPTSPSKPERQKPCDVSENSDRPKNTDEESLEQKNGDSGYNDNLPAEAQIPSTERGLLAQGDGFVRVADCGELNAGPDERPFPDAQHASSDETEVDTEEQGNLQDGLGDIGRSGAEADLKLLKDHRLQFIEDERVQVLSIPCEQDHVEHDTESAAEGNSPMDMADNREITDIVPCAPASNHQLQSTESPEEGVPLADDLRTAMPPPLLVLDTNFSEFGTAGAQVPIGAEPSSPTLKPLDSSTLPLPSPFPGEHDPNVTSYLDHTILNEHVEHAHTDAKEDEFAPIEADYIMETSFYSSISSSKAGTFHPTHESAFTPVRFTFGMDGAGASNTTESSSPDAGRSYVDISTAPPMTSTIAAVQLETDRSMTTGKMSESANDSSDPCLRKSVANTDFEVNHDADVYIDKDDDARKNASPGIEYPSYWHTSGKAHSGIDRDAREAVTESTESIATRPFEDDIEMVQGYQSPKILGEPVSTQQSAVISEIVDLGSPSEDSNIAEDVMTESSYNVTSQGELEDEHLQPRTATHRSPTPMTQCQDPTIRRVESASKNDYSESAAIGHVYEDSASVDSHSKSITYTISSQAFNNENNSLVDNWEPQLDMEYPNPLMQGMDLLPEAPTAPRPATQTEEFFPDIKMESVENDFLLLVDQQDVQPSQDHENVQDSDEILIAVPREGDKLGKMEYISLPATAPARNTRSKTKASTSPSKEDRSVSKRLTRSSGSKAFLVSNTRENISPPRMRSRSTISQPQDVPHTSLSDSRPWSKLRSPTQGTSVFAASVTPRSARKPDPAKSTSLLDLASPQTNPDTFATSYELSQELGGSQGRFSNVSFVKDSEEDSLHSEHSISTVDSDNWTEAPIHAPTDLNGPDNDVDRHFELLTQSKPKPRMFISNSPIQPSDAQPRVDSLSRDLHSVFSASTTSFVHTYNDETNIEADQVSSSASAHDGEHCDKTPDSGMQDIARVGMSSKDEDNNDHLQSLSPPPIDNDEPEHDSSLITAVEVPSIKRQSIVESNSLITPGATQQTPISSQPSRPQQQSISLTPHLTQATSTSFSSFQKLMDKSPVVEMSGTEGTPRRDAADVEIASSPSLHSADDSNSDNEATLVAHSEQPSIGLSTPLSYYTPLKDLVYFLNRSSQFHSSANPDILALATSASSVATKAAKGPQHWMNMLHITDLSSWPAVTTVQIFRAHQTALPVVEKGDVVLLRAFGVKSLNRSATLISGDESSWCVWRYGKPVWGATRGAFGELRAREEVRGPAVERGEGEWKEVERLRGWYANRVKNELDDKEHDN